MSEIAEKVQLAGEIGALQYCQKQNLHSADAVFDDAFYKLAGIMRKWMEGSSDYKAAAAVGWGEYKEANQTGKYHEFTAKPGAPGKPKLDRVDKSVQGVDSCKAIEAKLRGAMKKGGVLDVQKAPPIGEPPKSKQDT